jgi:hypothetical protein
LWLLAFPETSLNLVLYTKTCQSYSLKEWSECRVSILNINPPLTCFQVINQVLCKWRYLQKQHPWIQWLTNQHLHQ